MKIASIVFLPVLFITLFGQAQEVPAVGGDDGTQTGSSLFHDKKKATDLFFDANAAKLSDNPEKAIRLFTECVHEDPGNDAAWYELSLLHYNENNPEKSIEYAKKAWELDPQNTWYCLTLAELYSNNSQAGEALKIYRQLHLAYPENTEYAIDLANTLLMLNKPQDAIDIYDQLENRFGVNEEFSMQKNRIYLAIGKNKKALEEIEKLSAANPDDSRILSMLAEFYNVQGYSDKALKTYQKIQEVDPENPYINISLADYYRKKGDLKRATEYLKAGFQNPYLDANTKIQVMMTYYSQTGDYDGIQSDVLDLSRILVEMHPNEPRAQMLRGEILMMSENWNEALAAFRKANALDPGKYQVWENILRLDALDNNIEQLAEDSKQAIELFPVQPLPYYFSGYSNYLLKRYDSAISSLTAGLKFITNDNAMFADFYSLSGDVYYASGKPDEAFRAYESSLKYNPENASVLNNYAYYLSLRNEDLEKAATMAEKANQLSPGNATYLDTRAWVLYRQGHYDQAGEQMEAVFKLDKNPGAVLMEHYGDILYKLNKPAEALEWWNKAKEAGEGSDFLDLKIKDGKLYE